MHRLAGVLDDRVAHDLRAAGLGIDLDVADVGGEGNASAIRHDLGVTRHWPAGVGCRGGDFLQRQRRQVAVLGAHRLGMASFPGDVGDRDFPHLGRTLLQHLDGVAGGENACHRGREGAAAAVGHVVMAERAGVGDDRLHLRVGDAQLLGDAQRQRGARAADIDRADGERHRAVDADIDVGAGLAAEVEPEAAGHAAALVGAERGTHVRMVLGGFQRRSDADRSVDRAIGRLGALLRRVLDAEGDRVHAELLGDLVHHAFDREGGGGGRGGAVGGRLRTVHQHFVAARPDILEVIAGKRRHGAELGPDRQVGTGCKAQFGGGCRDRAVLLDANLDVNRGGTGRTRSAEHLVAGHHQLHRTVGLARQRQRHRLGPDVGLAAEAAADLGRGDAELRDVHAEQLGTVVAVDEVALSAHPQLAGAVRADAGHAGMRLDIALV